MRIRFAVVGEVPFCFQEYVEYAFLHSDYGIVTVIDFGEERAARRTDAALADNVYVWTCPVNAKDYYLVGTGGGHYHFIREKRDKENDDA